MSSQSAYANLVASAAAEVENARQTIFFRWPNPKVPDDEKAAWLDDLAVLYVKFGAYAFLEALSWHRLNTERRPSLPAIQERCRTIRDAQGDSNHTDPAKIEAARYERDFRAALDDPDNTEFTPYAFVVRDYLEFREVRDKAIADGETLDAAAIERWWAWRFAATDAEWSALRRKGIRGLRVSSAPATPGVSVNMPAVKEIGAQPKFLFDAPF